jgi:hypothetical protein
LFLAAPGTALATDAHAPDPAPAPAPTAAPAPDAVPSAAAPPPATTQPPPTTQQPTTSSPPASTAPPASTPSAAAESTASSDAAAPQQRKRHQHETTHPQAARQLASIDWTNGLPVQFTGDRGLHTPDKFPLVVAAIALLLLVIAGAASLRLTLRLAGPLAALTIALALVPMASAQESVTPRCDTPSTSDQCDHWYTTGTVSLQWSWSALGTLVSGCQNGNFSAEGSFQSSCAVSWPGTVITKSVFIGIDRTPPAVSAVPDRPPDYGGWFNHPVGIRFVGSDATSGVGSCDSSVPYGGPQGQGVVVSGRCWDVAGNVASGSYAVNYDATPPPAPEVDATPGDNKVDIDWSPEGGTVAVEVARVGSGGDRVLYRGSKREFVDQGLKNGVRHRYLVTAIDQAGNRAARETSAVPTASALLTPAAGLRVKTPPALDWKARRGATYYNVQVYRDGRKVLSTWPKASELRMHKRWRFAGKRFRLVPGRYVWYVWPGFGKRADRRYGHMLGKKAFVVVR